MVSGVSVWLEEVDDAVGTLLEELDGVVSQEPEVSKDELADELEL